MVEPMCRNIKLSLPTVNIIFIVNSLFKEIPLGFNSVDKIYYYDKKNKNKGLMGYFNFLKDFKEKNIDYAIITHPHERSLILAKLIGSKNIVSLPIKRSFLNFFINKKRVFSKKEIRNTYKADYNNGYLKEICDYKNFSVKYLRFDINEKNILKKFNLEKEYIVLSPTSKDLIKDWDYENIKKFILNSENKIVLVGTEKANIIANQLKNENINFIDLTLKTNITELASIIKNSKCCVSVDTGTFHLSYAQGVKTFGLFFNEKMVVEWAPLNLDFVKIFIGKKERKGDVFFCSKNISYKEVIKEIEKL